MTKLIDSGLLKKALGITDEVTDKFTMISLAEVCEIIDKQAEVYNVKETGKKLLKNAIQGEPRGLILTKDAYEIVTGISEGQPQGRDHRHAW